jgi:hypothetical protein
MINFFFLFCRRQQSGELYKEPLLATYRPDPMKTNSLNDQENNEDKRSLKHQDKTQTTRPFFLFCRRQQSGELYKEPLLATYRPDPLKIDQRTFFSPGCIGKTYRPDPMKTKFKHDVGKEDSLLLLPLLLYHEAGKYGLYGSPGHHYVLPY